MKITPETIHGLLRQEQHKFRIHFHQVPNRIYLGRKEVKALDEYADRYIPHRLPREDAGTRRQYEGMEIFEVDADNHIDFGVQFP